MAGEIRISGRQRIDAPIVHPQSVHLVQKVVADRAVDGPILVEALAVFQYLFDVQAPARQQSTQSLEVPERIAQAIRMIDAQTVDLTLCEHRLDACMGGLKQLGVALHTQDCALPRSASNAPHEAGPNGQLLS